MPYLTAFDNTSDRCVSVRASVTRLPGVTLFLKGALLSLALKLNDSKQEKNMIMANILSHSLNVYLDGCKVLKLSYSYMLCSLRLC